LQERRVDIDDLTRLDLGEGRQDEVVVPERVEHGAYAERQGLPAERVGQDLSRRIFGFRMTSTMPQDGQDFRAHLTPDREDDLAFDYPKSAIADEGLWVTNEIMRLYRKVSLANQHSWDRRIELELIGRFIVALKGFRDASDKASKRLELATWVLIALTIVIAAFTIALFFHD
jgi:hypothetical protein